MDIQKNICIFASKTFKSNIMEQIVIISCMVIFILLCCYWLVKFILNCRKEFKLEDKNNELVKEIEFFNEKFKNLLITVGLDNTTWGYYSMNIIEECIKTALDIHPLWTAEEKNKRYISYIDIINEKYVKFKNEIINKIIPEIDYNLEKLPKLLINFPNFFVAESVGGIKDSLYCHSYNMEFDTSNLTFSGIVFTNVNSNGSLRYFNPKDWGIRVMTEYEFNKIFLPNILNDCGFKDVRELKSYSNHLKKEFKNFKEKYE